jgi:dihydroneopterin triphosphate diphosphatase
MRKIQTQCIVFKRNPLQFLLLKRIPSKGGFWQPVSGGLEGDETPIEAAYRELEEETNIHKPNVVKVFENVHEFTINKHYLTSEHIEPIKEVVFGFEVSDIEVFITQNVHQEHEEFRWVSYEEALKMLKWDNNKEGIRKMRRII